MVPSILAVVLLVVFSIASMVYVYRYRGAARFADVDEYLSKGWPIFAPLNCALYFFTERRARKPIADIRDFPELAELQAQWETIRDEAAQLYENGYFDVTKENGSAASYDVGFRTFYKYGWSKFYLTWYGEVHESAKRFCPRTVEILSGVKQVNGAMFSILPPGSKLTRHLDPVACSLRYHLGLSTPETESCFIDVDGQRYSWRNGEALLFDETYLHFVRNDSDTYRIILMCDVERPLGAAGRIVNAAYKTLMRLTVVPNLEGDKRGIINRVFGALAPALARSKALKQSNRSLYKSVKYTVNSILILLVFAIVASAIFGIYLAVQGLAT